MRYQVTIAAVVAVTGLIVGAGGCGQRKLSECNALVDVINKGVASLERSQKAGTDSNAATEIKPVADAMDKVAQDAAQVKLTIPELQKFSADYQAMAKEVAKAAREMAGAVEANNQEKITSAQAALDKAVKQEDPLVESINKFCHDP
jgi:hypothetical protein